MKFQIDVEKLSAAELDEYVDKLNAAKAAKVEQESQEKRLRLLEAVNALGITTEEAISMLRPADAKPVIFRWRGNEYRLQKGKPPSWTKELYAEIPRLEDALKFALDQEGREWITRVYHKKSERQS